MFIESEIVVHTRKYVEELMGESLSKDLSYHNLQHTREVVEAALEIGEKTDLTEDQMEMVVLAAWLHDTGYSNGKDNHELESKSIANKILEEQNYPYDRLKTVLDSIEATRMPQSPKTLVAEVLCDADLFHLANDQFRAKSILLKQELEVHRKTDINDEEWLQENLDFFKQHRYFTNFGKYVLEPRKSKNLKKLKKLNKGPKLKGKDKGKAAKTEKYVDKLENEIVKLKNRIDKDKEIRPTRGIETMFRVTSRNHLTLSGMADNKANIMISVNSIILSIVLTVLFRKFGENPNLVIPALALIATSLTTIIFSILATRPNVSSGTFTEENIRNKETNLLFFGNFHRVNINSYLWGMKEMMKDGDYLYGSLIKDIYYLGVVLGIKYRMLRISYTIFMFGLIISIILFVLSQIYPAIFAVGA
jgi:predicted metal-dependent HD superfamily phosphohydrolase